METVTELPFIETEDTTPKNPPRTYSSMKSFKETQSKEQNNEVKNDNPETVEEENSVKKPKIIKKATNLVKK